MFPDLRLAVAAFLASVIGISCGLALFAAFRVNREPFAQVANGATPLQLVLAAPVSVVAADRTDRLGVPFGVRFEVNAAPAVSAPPGQAAPAVQTTPGSVALVSPLSQTSPSDAKPVAQQRHRVAHNFHKSVTAAQPGGPFSPFTQPANAVPEIR
jgi:hypothetical protein